MSSRRSVSVLITVIILLDSASLDSAGEPPYLPSVRQWEVRDAQPGQDLSLRCPVTASLYRWYHHHTEITQPASQPSYHLHGRRLSIKSVSPRLVGNYTCKGVNGFGTASYSFLITLNTPGELEAGGRQRVLVEGVLEDRTVMEGDSLTLTCSLHSLHQLSLAWGRKLQPGQTLGFEDRIWGPLVNIGEDVYTRVPPDDPQVLMSDKFVMSDSGPSYEYSLTFIAASQHHAGQYVCVVFSGESPVDHQSALLAVTPQQRSALSQARSLPNLTIVLAVLGSIVLLLLTVLMVLLCQKPGEKRHIPPSTSILASSSRNSKERQLRAKDGDDLANFI